MQESGHPLIRSSTAFAFLLVALLVSDLRATARPGLATRTCSILPGLQEPKVLKAGNVSIVVTHDEQAALGDRLVEVVAVVTEGLKPLGLTLPKGTRITLHDRASYEAVAKSLGVAPSNLRATVYAYCKMSGWTPVLHVLAEQTDRPQVIDGLSMFVANGLGGLTGVSQSQSSVPPISDYGLAGCTEALYRMSALRNGGTAIPLQAVAEMQKTMPFLANQQPRVAPRVILRRTPTNEAELHQATQFLNVLLHESPAPTRAAVAKVVMAWPKVMNATPDDKQVTRMETELVEAVGIKGAAIKTMKLDDKMDSLGIDKKLRKEPGSLLWAYYEVQLDRLAEACATAKQSAEKPAKPADK